jgi:hypothetical protein
MLSTAFEEAFDFHPTALPDGVAQTVTWYRSVLARS